MAGATDHVALDNDGSLFAFHPDNIGHDDLGFASWLRAASEALDLQCAATAPLPRAKKPC